MHYMQIKANVQSYFGAKSLRKNATLITLFPLMASELNLTNLPIWKGVDLLISH